MIDTKRQKLPGHERPKSTPTERKGSGCSMGCGLILLALSAGITAFYLGLEEFTSLPLWQVAAVGVEPLLISLLGICFLYYGLSPKRQARKLMSVAMPLPERRGQTIKGAVSGDSTKWIVFLEGGLFFAIFGYGAAIAFFSEREPVLIIFAVLLSIFSVLGLSYAAVEYFRYKKYGRSVLRYDTYPYIMGETLEATLFTQGAIGSFSAFKATLRCVEETLERIKVVTSDGSKVVNETAHYQIWADSLELKDGVAPSGENGYQLAFKLPDGSPAKPSCKGKDPVYWELDISAVTTDVDYEARFPVPVKAREEPAGTAVSGQ